MLATNSKTNHGSGIWPDIENCFTILEAAPDAWGLQDVIERIEWERDQKNPSEETLWEYIGRAQNLQAKYDLEDKASIDMTHNRSSLRWLVEWMHEEEYVDRPKQVGFLGFRGSSFNIADWRKEDPRFKKLVQAIEHFDNSFRMRKGINLLSGLATKISTLGNSEETQFLKTKMLGIFLKAVGKNIDDTWKYYSENIKEHRVSS